MSLIAIAAGVDKLVTITATLNHLAAGAAMISSMIQKAQAEGRSEFTADEWATIQGADTAARDVLADAIVNALKKGAANG
jgi:hypothetical protein